MSIKTTFSRSRNKTLLSDERGRNMNWFDLLKVDIDFDKEIGAMGQYSEGVDFESREEFGKFMDKLLSDMMFRGKSPDMKDFIKENIKINHQRINAFLKEKLGRQPTDKELIRYITRVIMHEGTHAGMGEEQDAMATHQAEYGAYTGQFPESTYIRLKEFVKHPATKRMLFPPELAAMIGIDPSSAVRTPDIIERVEELIAYIDGITEDIPAGKQRDDFRERLARLEMSARTKGEPEVRHWPHQNAEEYYRFSLNRYGNENKDLIDALARANGFYPDEAKAAMAVTTTSAPSLFNIRYSPKKKKKKRDD